MNIRTSKNQNRRGALAIADDMPFRAVFAAIHGIGACLRPPNRARTELLSTTVLDQSILSANPDSSRSTFQTFCQTPPTCQSQKASPTRHPTAANQLRRQQFPRRSKSCNEQNSRQDETVGNTGSPSLGIRIDWWKERLDFLLSFSRKIVTCDLP